MLELTTSVLPFGTEPSKDAVTIFHYYGPAPKYAFSKHFNMFVNTGDLSTDIENKYIYIYEEDGSIMVYDDITSSINNPIRFKPGLEINGIRILSIKKMMEHRDPFTNKLIDRLPHYRVGFESIEKERGKECF